MKTLYLCCVQDRQTKHVFGYLEVEALDKYYAKRTALAQVEKEKQYTKQWDKLQGHDWCIDATEI